MKKNKRGSILVTTLWIMAILSLLAAGIGFRASLEVRLGKYAMDRLEGRYLAKAGILKMIQYIRDDRKTKYDTLYECGIALEEEETPEDIFGPESNKLQNGTFSIHYEAPRDPEEEGEEEAEAEETYAEFAKPEKVYGITDEERKININLKTENMTETEFRNIMGRLLGGAISEEEGEVFSTEDGGLVTAILHWQGKAGGNIEHGTAEHPYKPKKAPFEFAEELLLVKGMTRRIFNGIKDYITVYGNGKINVNTAPREVLAAIIPSPEIADYVIDGRNGPDKKKGTEDDGWRSVAAFTAYLGTRIKNPAVYSKYFTVKSNNFRIVSHGNKSRVESVITCVIDRNAPKEKEKFKYYHEE